MGKSQRLSRAIPGRAVTIRDVARRAGVSTATVSRALADPERVAEGTRKNVFAAISATGFTPNASARSLRAKTTKMVLALLPGIGNSFYSAILNAVEDVLTEAGYGFIIGDTRKDPVREKHYVRLVRAGQVDGVLLFTGHMPRDDTAMIDSGVPISLVCNDIPEYTGLSVFDADNRAAARTLTEHLIAIGHRRIAHAFGSPWSIEAKERAAGYADALRAARLKVDRALIWPGDFTPHGGEMAAERFLAMAPAERPTAVFCAADESALAFIRSVREAGIKVPGDVSVAGFDDVEFATLSDPPLTTMRQPRTDLGRLAAADLLKRMARGAPAPPPTRRRLPCELIIRASTRPIAAPQRTSRSRA